MKLIVDSGSTKADWIAIDDSGKILFILTKLQNSKVAMTKKIPNSRMKLSVE
jgi:N-methylhydantoinase A/oxoprolinase/acetone carboxylase beta subunit